MGSGSLTRDRTPAAALERGLSHWRPGKPSTLSFKLLFKRVCLCAYVCTYLHGCAGKADMELLMEASTGGPEGSREKRVQRPRTRGGARDCRAPPSRLHGGGRRGGRCAARRSGLGRYRSFHISQQGSEKYLSHR